MPELPEVETVRRGLAPVMVGHVLKDLILRRYELRIPFPEGFSAKLIGRRMVSLRRRAKYLLLDLEGGETVAMHMGMSGRFTIAARDSFGPSYPGEPYDAMTLVLRIKGSDLADYRADRLTLDEARKRVEVREF